MLATIIYSFLVVQWGAHHIPPWVRQILGWYLPRRALPFWLEPHQTTNGFAWPIAELTEPIVALVQDQPANQGQTRVAALIPGATTRQQIDTVDIDGRLFLDLQVLKELRLLFYSFNKVTHQTCLLPGNRQSCPLTWESSVSVKAGSSVRLLNLQCAPAKTRSGFKNEPTGLKRRLAYKASGCPYYPSLWDAVQFRECLLP